MACARTVRTAACTAQTLAFAMVFVTSATAVAGRTPYGWVDDTQVASAHQAQLEVQLRETIGVPQSRSVCCTPTWRPESTGVSRSEEMTMSRCLCLFALVLAACSGSNSLPPSGDCELPPIDGIDAPVAEPIALGNGTSFDDLFYSKSLGKVVVPYRRAGAIYFVDPSTMEVTVASGLPADLASADAGGGWVFGASRTSNQVVVVDPGDMAIAATVSVSARPDYARFSPDTGELWVTEPGNDRIEVLSVSGETTPTLGHAAFIETPGGPEGLVFDGAGRAYAHVADLLAVIDVEARRVVDYWYTGCSGHHGFPQVDVARGLVFVGCGSNGAGVVLDASSGERAAGYEAGGSEAVLAYAPALGHFYLRGDPGPTVSMLGVCDDGSLALLAEPETAQYGHAMAADEVGNLWVADPARGGLLRLRDPYPAIE